MTREELINKGSSGVRNNATLFALFKEFLIEDWGGIPEGCFGCQFSTTFERWQRQVLSGTTKETILQKKDTDMNTYILKDKHFKTYFKGEVLSANSSDAEWKEFLEKSEENKARFLVLPSEFSTPKEKAEEAIVIEGIEKKNVKSTKKASVEVAKSK
jgi:hypothetical protein